jgi:hypothetical protein
MIATLLIPGQAATMLGALSLGRAWILIISLMDYLNIGDVITAHVNHVSESIYPEKIAAVI